MVLSRDSVPNEQEPGQPEVQPIPKTAEKAKNEINCCPTCQKTFDRLYNLKVHLRKHTGETPYHCPASDCAKKFKWRSSMAHHIRAHHNGTSADIANIRKHDTGLGDKHTHAASASILGLGRSSGAIAKKTSPKGSGKGTRKKLTTSSKQKLVSQNGTASPKPSGSSATESLDNSPKAKATALDEIAGQAADLEAIFESFGNQLKAVEIPEVQSESRLLSMVSDMLATDEEVVYETSIQQTLEIDVSIGAFDNSMLFLATGSDNATDADMECKAHSDGVISTPELDVQDSKHEDASMSLALTHVPDV